MCLIVLRMCMAGFTAGAFVARACGPDPAQRAALVLGLGVTHNGTCRAVAASGRAHMPSVVLPVLFSNRIQHLVASVFATRMDRRCSRPWAFGTGEIVRPGRPASW